MSEPSPTKNWGEYSDTHAIHAHFCPNFRPIYQLLFLLAVKARRMLAGFMVLTAFIQLVDVINDLARGAVVLVPGLLVFAIVFLIGAWQLFGQAFWYVDAWRERS